ncbi:MAG: trypsin-like serine peptidase [Usitatibacter sp.]
MKKKVTWYLFLSAMLIGASLAGQAADRVEGATKPRNPAAKAAQRLPLEDQPVAASTLELPALSAAARLEIEAGLEPNQIGISRMAQVDALPAIDQDRMKWIGTSRGFVTRMRVTAPGAAGLRVGLRFDAMPADLEIRVAQPLPDGSLEVVDTATSAGIAKLARGIWPMEHWTASTDGEEQVIELASARRPAPNDLRFKVFDVSHFLQKATDPIRPKVLTFSCHVDVACVADANVGADRRAVARMLFTDGGTFLCTGSLLNDRVSSLTPLFATANHCIHTAAAAASLETLWFFYPATCGGFAQAGVRVTGGASLLLADFDTDFTLLRLARDPPAGVSFLGWSPDPLAVAQPVFGIHHPDGGPQKYSSGNFLGLARITDSDTHVTFAQPFNRVSLVEGIIEGGSSGSPLLTAPGTFHGTLFGSPSTNACGLPNNYASYSDFSVAYPMAAGYLAGPGAADDHGNTPGTATAIAANGQLVAEINSTSDEDWFRVAFAAAGTWTVTSFDPAPGQGIDVRGEIYLADGATLLAANDDRSLGDLNFSMTVTVGGPTTLYLRVLGNPGVVGHYGIRTALVLPDDFGDAPGTAANLPANGTASGFLGTAADQDWFRITLDGPGTLRVSSTGTTDTIGRLFRSDGTTQIVENDDANPPDTNFGVGTVVTGPTTIYLQVTGFDGETGAYGLVTAFTSGITANYTDLWWNSAESGWGLNLNHQSDKIFATLYTYAPDGRDMWLVASSLPRQPDGSYAGALYRAVGPAFNASPWTSYTLTQVGTMTLAFAGSNQGTLTYSVNGVSVTKAIQRNLFSSPQPICTFTSASRAAAPNFQDLWLNPAEPGWGINLAQQGGVMFATLFTYDIDHRDLWLVGSNLVRQQSGTFTGTLYRITGPAFNAVPWTSVASTTVGTMTLAFASGTSGTLIYTFNGTTVTKSIQRFVFAASPSLCQ